MVIWKPYFLGQINSTEKIATYQIGKPIHFPYHNFAKVYKSSNISTVKSSSIRNYNIIAFKIFTNTIDDVELPSYSRFFILHRPLRNKDYFFIPNYTQQYFLAFTCTPIRRIMQ